MEVGALHVLCHKLYSCTVDALVADQVNVRIPGLLPEVGELCT